jgi:hypothetical protein
MSFEEQLGTDWEEEEMREPHRVDRGDVVVRALYSVLFAIAISLLESVLFFVVVFQLVYSGVTQTHPSERLQHFANGLVAYFHQILRYLVHGDSVVPFPFSDFPDSVESRPASHSLGHRSHAEPQPESEQVDEPV